MSNYDHRKELSKSLNRILLEIGTTKKPICQSNINEDYAEAFKLTDEYALISVYSRMLKSSLDRKLSLQQFESEIQLPDDASKDEFNIYFNLLNMLEKNSKDYKYNIPKLPDSFYKDKFTVSKILKGALGIGFGLALLALGGIFPALFLSPFVAMPAISKLFISLGSIYLAAVTWRSRHILGRMPIWGPVFKDVSNTVHKNKTAKKIAHYLSKSIVLLPILPFAAIYYGYRKYKRKDELEKKKIKDEVLDGVIIAGDSNTKLFKDLRFSKQTIETFENRRNKRLTRKLASDATVADVAAPPSYDEVAAPTAPLQESESVIDEKEQLLYEYQNDCAKPSAPPFGL